MIKSKDTIVFLIITIISLMSTVQTKAQERDKYAVVIKGAYVLEPEPVTKNKYKIIDHLDVRKIVKLNSLTPIPVRNIITNQVDNYYEITTDSSLVCLIRTDLIQKLDADYIVPQTGSFMYFYQPRPGEPISALGSDKKDTWGYFQINKWNPDGSINVSVIQHVESEKYVKTIIPSYDLYPEKFDLDKSKFELKSYMESPITEFKKEMPEEEAIKNKYRDKYFISYVKEYDANSEEDEFIDDLALLKKAKLFYASKCGPREIARYVITYMQYSCSFDMKGKPKDDIIDKIKTKIDSNPIPTSNTLYISRLFTRFEDPWDAFLDMYKISKVHKGPPDSYLVICCQGNCDESQGKYIENAYIQRFVFRRDPPYKKIDPLIKLFRDKLLDIVGDNERIKADKYYGNKMFLIKGGQGRDYMSEVLNEYLNLTQYEETFRKFMVSTIVDRIFAFEK